MKIIRFLFFAIILFALLALIATNQTPAELWQDIRERVFSSQAREQLANTIREYETPANIQPLPSHFEEIPNKPIDIPRPPVKVAAATEPTEKLDQIFVFKEKPEPEQPTDNDSITPSQALRILKALRPEKERE